MFTEYLYNRSIYVHQDFGLLYSISDGPGADVRCIVYLATALQSFISDMAKTLIYSLYLTLSKCKLVVNFHVKWTDVNIFPHDKSTDTK